MALLHHVSQPVRILSDAGPELLRLGGSEARIKLEQGQQDLLGHLESALTTVAVVVDAQVCYNATYCECEGIPSDGRPCIWVVFENSTSTGMMASAIREAIRSSDELRQFGD